MNKKLIFIGIAALLFLLLLGAEVLGLEGSLSLICLPFLLAAKGLRALSLSGSIGNLAAIVLLAAMGLLPLLLKGKEPWNVWDLLLGLTACAIWYGEYYLINPALLPPILSGTVGQLVLCGGIYSLLLSWAVVRLLKATSAMDSRQLLRALEIFLWICAGECVLSAFAALSALPEAYQALRDANTMPGLDLKPTYVFLTLSQGISALEYCLDAWVLFLGAGLFRTLEAGLYTETAVAAGDRVGLWCRRSLLIIVLSNTALNLGQILFASRLHDLSAAFRLPVLSLAIVFALLVLSGLLHRGRQLQEDNELFI